MSGLTVYRGVCRASFLLFASLFSAMLLAPARLAWVMSEAAHGVGLSGVMAVGTGDVDFVWALAYLGTLTALSAACAARPALTELFWTMLTGLSIAAVGFVFLALADGSAWMLGAVGHFGLAAVLIAARVSADRTRASRSSGS